MICLFCLCFRQKEANMKNKHMTFEMRERIEFGIRNNESLKEISVAINKDPTTISKDVLKHKNSAKDEHHYVTFSHCHSCIYLKDCILTKVCNREKCTRRCKTCLLVDVPSKCKKYIKRECKRLNRLKGVTCLASVSTTITNKKTPRIRYEPDIVNIKMKLFNLYINAWPNCVRHNHDTTIIYISRWLCSIYVFFTCVTRRSCPIVCAI